MIETGSMRIVLSSASPRRQQLMQGLDIPFEIEVRPTDESYPASLHHGDVAAHIARAKLAPWQNELQEDQHLMVITCDTIVVLDGKIIEKPTSEEDAKRMLKELSGNTHTVYTGCAIAAQGKQEVFTDETQVTFKPLTSEEIEYYVAKYEPFDKAGSYGVQEWLGYVAVADMQGSYFNVMGLPLHLMYQKLNEFKFS